MLQAGPCQCQKDIPFTIVIACKDKHFFAIFQTIGEKTNIGRGVVPLPMLELCL